MTISLYENTFVTLNEANTYFGARPNSALWTSLSDTDKENALSYATLKINSLEFVGDKVSNSQPLEFPRNLSTQLPNDIKYAVCEEAYAIIENSVHHKNHELGIESFSLGDSSFNYSKNPSASKIFSQQAYNFLSKWLVKNFNMS